MLTLSFFCYNFRPRMLRAVYFSRRETNSPQERIPNIYVRERKEFCGGTRSERSFVPSSLPTRLRQAKSERSHFCSHFPSKIPRKITFITFYTGDFFGPQNCAGSRQSGISTKIPPEKPCNSANSTFPPLS